VQVVQAPRASAILYNLVKSRQGTYPWLLPANICPIVPITFLKTGVPFELVDISPETLHMDWTQAETLVNRQKFGGLLYAHTYGEPSPPYDFLEGIKKKNPNLLIIDDCCLCTPQLEADDLNPADVQLYSTGYGKVVDLNFGGYAFVRDDIKYKNVSLPFTPQAYDGIENLYKQAIHQRSRFVYHDSNWLDTTSPMPDWDAYRHQIERHRAEALQHSSSLNAVYVEMLPAEIQLPRAYQDWRFNICVKNQQHILAAIFSAGLFASSHYASLAGIFGDGIGGNANSLANEVINLFNDYHFTPKQAEQVCQVVLENLQ